MKVNLANLEDVYRSVEQSHPTKRIPYLMGLKDAARVLKSSMNDRFWDEAAAHAILARFRLPHSTENMELVVKTRSTFTDEQWSWLAMEFYKDQPASVLYTVLKPSDGYFKSCQECGDDFYFYLPKRCKKCHDEFRAAVADAKGNA